MIQSTKHDTVFMRKTGVLVLVLDRGKCCIVVAKGLTRKNRNLWAIRLTIFP